MEKKDYEKNKGNGTIHDLKEYMNISNGGMARTMSRRLQLDHLDVHCKAFPNWHYDYYDIEITAKYNGMDKLQYLDDYDNFGYQMSKKPLISK